MDKYICGQWFKCAGTYGFVIATNADKALSLAAGYESDSVALTGPKRAEGYCVQWVDLIGDPPTSWTARSKRWISNASLADKRYVPCENPLATTPEPEQTALPLDVDAATVALLRDAVAAGDKARDILRAKGLAA